jgi:hypothetical protein
MSDEVGPSEQWHLDKKVPLAMIGAMVIQTVAIVWFAAKLDSRVGALEESDRRAEIRFSAISSDRDRLVRVEEKVSLTTELLREIKQTLERRATPERQH